MANPTSPAALAAHIQSKPGFAIGFPAFVKTINTPSHRFYAKEIRIFEAYGLVCSVVEFDDHRSQDRLARASLTDLGREVAALLAA